MSGALPWNLLVEQYKEEKSYRAEVAKLIVSPERVLSISCIILHGYFLLFCVVLYLYRLKANTELKDLHDQSYKNLRNMLLCISNSVSIHK